MTYMYALRPLRVHVQGAYCIPCNFHPTFETFWKIVPAGVERKASASAMQVMGIWR